MLCLANKQQKRNLVFLTLFLVLTLPILSSYNFEDTQYGLRDEQLGDTFINQTISGGGISATNVAFLNESNQLFTGNQSTDGWWNGLFNWTTLTDWLNFDGAILSFNSSKAGDTFVNISGDSMTGNLSMGNNSIIDILSTHYNITGCTDETPGTFCYDVDYDTMRFVTDSGQILQMNQETTMPSKNIEGSTAPDGSIVYLMGATGANPNFKLAKADNLSTAGLVGIVTKECINNQVCPVVFFGIIHGVNTTAYSAGDHLYLSETQAGNFTTTNPEFPDVPIWVATALRIHETEGTIFVFPRLDSANGITMNSLGLVGDFIQTDYKIRSLEGHANLSGKNVMCLEMNGTTGNDTCHLTLQPGGIGMASIWTRGGIVVPENLDCLNGTNRTNAQCWADEGGFSWGILDFNATDSEGADWGITGELEVIKGIYSHGNVNMGQNNLTNISQLQAEDGSAIRFGADVPFSGMDQAINIQTNQTLGEGVITHTLTDRQGGKVIAAWQSGLNGSWGYHRNSKGIFPDFGITNATFLSNANLMWEFMNITPRLSYDSSQNETSLGVLYGIETQQLFLHNNLGNGLLQVEGDANIILGVNEEFDVIGTIHPRQQRQEEIGLDAGENESVLFESFESGVLGDFNLLTTGKGIDEWSAIANTGDCLDGGDFCSHAGASGGSLNTTMEANFSSINFTLNNLSFGLATIQLNIAGEIMVTINNNSGSGELGIYNLTGSNLNNNVTVVIPDTMDNVSEVSLRYYFSSANPTLGDVWVDDVNISATASVSTLANVTRTDTEILLGDGSQRMFWNDTTKTLELPGNVSFQDVTETTVNVTTSIELAGDTITNWDNISLFDESVLLTNGSRPLIGEWDFGSFGINGTGTINASFFDGDGSRLINIQTFNSTYAGLIQNSSYLSTFNITYNALIANASYLNLAWINQTNIFSLEQIMNAGLNVTGDLNLTVTLNISNTLDVNGGTIFKGGSHFTIEPVTGQGITLNDDGGVQRIGFSNGGNISLTPEDTMVEVTGDLEVTGTINKGLIQIQHVSDTALHTINTANIMSYNDAIPVNTEGGEVTTLSITPKFNDSQIVITMQAWVRTASGSQIATMALFRDSVSNALATTSAYADPAAHSAGIRPLYIQFIETSGNINARTYKMRVGKHVTGVTYVNGDAAGRKYGGTANTFITIEEIRN